MWYAFTLRRFIVLVEQHMQSKLGLNRLQSLIAKCARRTIRHQLHNKTQILHKLAKRVDLVQCFVRLNILKSVVIVDIPKRSIGVHRTAARCFKFFVQFEHSKHTVFHRKRVIRFLGQRAFDNVDIQTNIFIVHQTRGKMSVLIFIHPSLAHHARSLQFATHSTHLVAIAVLFLALDPDPQEINTIAISVGTDLARVCGHTHSVW
mmetsp:Transcript_15734/g.24111  ORF Transcript_15734/g.24111 Transcript_15734/m.24111 type:complete len:205 (+) Transcript_15734:3-617(+)